MAPGLRPLLGGGEEGCCVSPTHMGGRELLLLVRSGSQAPGLVGSGGGPSPVLAASVGRQKALCQRSKVPEEIFSCPVLRDSHLRQTPDCFCN